MGDPRRVCVGSLYKRKCTLHPPQALEAAEEALVQQGRSLSTPQSLLLGAFLGPFVIDVDWDNP